MDYLEKAIANARRGWSEEMNNIILQDIEIRERTIQSHYDDKYGMLQTDYDVSMWELKLAKQRIKAITLTL